MKAIKVSEVRAIKKEFNLTEQEGWYLEDLADEVNNTKDGCCKTLQNDLFYGTILKGKKAAIMALLIFKGRKAQKNTGYLKLDMTSLGVAEMLKVRVCQVRQWIINIGASPRFGKNIVIATQFGQNFLEIAA